MSKSILVVDDEALIAMDIEMQLNERGHTVHVAASQQGALDILARESIDVAVIDGDLGRAGALELARALHQRQIPYVVCTGVSLGELTEVFQGVPFVAKPFQSEQLTSAIDAACGAGGHLR